MNVGLVGRLAVALAIGGFVVTACGFPEQRKPTTIEMGGDEGDPAGGLPRTERVTVWMVGDDRLVSVVRRVAAPVTADGVGEVVAAGVSPGEIANGLRTAIPDPAMLVSATVAGGTASVSLSREFLEIPAGDQVLALAQIVYTMTDLRGVGRVRFDIDGSPVAVPLPEGTSTEDSVSRDDYSALVPG